MDSKDANKIPLTEILKLYDREIVKSYPGYDMYHSPFRDERTPSFKVDHTTNRWQDFGSGQFGSVVDLVMKMENCSFVEAMKLIENKSLSTGARSNQPHLPRESKQHYKLEILNVAPLKNQILINYAKDRGIDQDVCQKWCKEIYYRIGENGKRCFALGFGNNSNSYEIRNPIFKGCSGKDITSIDNGSNKCAVFEGFFDLLSYMQIAKDKPELNNVNIVVLNTTAMIGKAEEFLKKHTTVHCFLDNDTSGKNTYQAITRMGVNAVNESAYIYPKFGDLNEYLQQDYKKKERNESYDNNLSHPKSRMKI